jgi:acyl-CoA synthetase (AMP-forming)/AMP-acid ligase II
MSPDGYITITGRIKDLIIRGGENIHPLEIENCLLTHPGVTDVSVVGVPDERYGEVVAAFIICKEQDRKTVTEDKIREWVRERLSNHLGKHLLPFSPSGKTSYSYLDMLTTISC